MKKRVGFSVVLFILLVGYGLGVMTAIAGWSGKQYIDKSMWMLESLPYYGFIFGSGFFSALAVMRWKRWGVYGLILTWAFTFGLNLIFVTSMPNYWFTIISMLLIMAFFIFLRPVWPEMT